MTTHWQQKYLHMGAFQFPTNPVTALAVARISPSEYVTMQLDFPECHAATFVSPPRAPGSLQLLQVFLAHVGQKIKSRWKRKFWNLKQT